MIGAGVALNLGKSVESDRNDEPVGVTVGAKEYVSPKENRSAPLITRVSGEEEVADRLEPAGTPKTGLWWGSYEDGVGLPAHGCTSPASTTSSLVPESSSRSRFWVHA